jgi:hypothetical protein
MASVSLLNSADPTFWFEHAMSHRNALGVIHPRTEFSVVPYFLDPPHNLNERASSWHLNHQQAHHDAALNLPAELGSSTLGVALWANLLEYRLDEPVSRSWWTFVNHLEHYVAAATILPSAIQPPPPAPQWKYPFW